MSEDYEEDLDDAIEEIDLAEIEVNEKGEVVKKEITSTEPKDPPKKIKGSATLIKKYRQCPASAYAKITYQPGTKGPALINGSAVHEVMEKYVKQEGQIDPIKIYDTYMQVEGEKNKIPLDTTEAWKIRTDGLKCVANGIKILNKPVDKEGTPFYKTLDPRYIERPFLFNYKDKIFKGFMDLVAFFNEGKNFVIGDFKGLALDTPIPIPGGWSSMGELKVGDEVFDRHGKICKVKSKSEIHFNPCYKITFDDKTEIICDVDHRWVVHYIQRTSKSSHIRTKVLTTLEILRDLKNSAGSAKYKIYNSKPLILPKKELVIDPYVLGVWLGDGSQDGGTVTKSDDFIFEEIVRRGFEVGGDISSNSTTTITKTIYGLRSLLEEECLLGEKLIPVDYLRSSIEDRLDLLRGLMDTVGYHNRIRNQSVFTNTKECLAYGVLELVHSLGMKGRLFKIKGYGFGKPVTAYVVAFTPYLYNPFLLPRKRDKVIDKISVRSLRRNIVNVEEIPTVPTQCIEVDSEDCTYLCGMQMIPTHNTSKRSPSRPDPKKTGLPSKANYELNTDTQFDIYSMATYLDESPPAKTKGIWPTHSTWIHLRGHSLDYHINKTGKNAGQPGKRLPVDEADPNKVQFDFKTERTLEEVTRNFDQDILPVMDLIELGYFYRVKGEHCNRCEYFDKEKERCGAEIPSDAKYKLAEAEEIKAMAKKLKGTQ